MPSCPCQGASAYQVAHLKMLMRAKLPITACRAAHSKVRLGAKDSNHMLHPCTKLPNARCHRVPMFPIACAPFEQNCPLQGAAMYVWFPSQGAIMCQVSHCREPLCAKDANRMVHLCAKLPTSSSQCMPILPIVRCHRVPILPIRLCHNVPREVIASFTRAPSCPPLFAKLAKSSCHRVPSCPSQGASTCQVTHHKVPLRAKLSIARCHCVLCCPSKGAIACEVPIASHCMPTCLSQGSITC